MDDQTSSSQRGYPTRRNISKKKTCRKKEPGKQKHVFDNSSCETPFCISNASNNQIIASQYFAIPPELALCPNERVLNFLFTTYARPSKYAYDNRGFMEHVILLYLSSAPESTVRYSTLAVANSLFGAWTNEWPLDNPVSRKFYLNAISAMKEQLTSSSTCSNDEMLVSVLLLQLYERVIGAEKKIPSRRAHLDGALAIIKYRGLNCFQSRTSLGLLFCVREQMIEEAFRSHQALPTDIYTWDERKPDNEQSPAIKLQRIDIDLVSLQGAMRCGVQNSNIIYQQAIEIERRLRLWYSHLPTIWLPTRISTLECIAPSISEAGLYQSYCTVYTSIPIANTLNKYHISLLKTKSILLSCLTQQPRSLTNLKKQAAYMNNIQQLADDICASVPFHLGDRTKPGRIDDETVQYPHSLDQELPEGHYSMAPAMGGWNLLDPLGTLLAMKIKLRAGQRVWIGGQMMRIARIYNFGKEE